MGMMLLGHSGGLALEQRVFLDLLAGFSKDSTELSFMIPLATLCLRHGQHWSMSYRYHLELVLSFLSEAYFFSRSSSLRGRS